MLNAINNIYSLLNEITSENSTLIYVLIGVGSLLIIVSIVMFIMIGITSKKEKKQHVLKKNEQSTSRAPRPVVKTIETKTQVVKVQTKPTENRYK